MITDSQMVISDSHNVITDSHEADHAQVSGD
jgi:hypothetical protein